MAALCDISSGSSLFAKVCILESLVYKGLIKGGFVHMHRRFLKSEYQKVNFLISHLKHMLWVLKRTVSMRWFF